MTQRVLEYLAKVVNWYHTKKALNYGGEHVNFITSLPYNRHSHRHV